jgi:hypothetical protein
MESNEFWADKVKRLKKEGAYDEVINICKKNIPLPAAFRELSIALRKKIIIALKQDKNINSKLNMLYELAVYHRFLFAYPTVKISKIAAFSEEGRIYPTFSVAGLAHNKGAMKKIKANYTDMGYKFIELLNKTDIKWMVTVWGEPKNHADPRQVYLVEWNKHLERFEKNIIKSNKRMINEWKKLLR